MLTDVDYAKDPYDCAGGADALVIVTEWDAFRALDLDRLKAALARRWWSTCATSIAPRRCAATASPTSASGGTALLQPQRRRTTPCTAGMGPSSII